VDARFVNCYLKGAQAVFKTMLRIDLEMGRPTVKTDRKASGDITGVIGFAGDKKGSFTISLKRQSALTIYGAFTGEDKEEVNDEVIDAVGELTNIISGQTRLELEKIGFNISASLPTVIIGGDVEINMITKAPIISLPFSFGLNGHAGEIFIDFSFE
jgi:chemotaxis protein CheX